MILEKDTNLILFSDLLPSRHPLIFSGIVDIISNNNIKFDFVHNTNDIWIRDYGLIQKSHNTFLKFKYYPDYLRERDENLITIPESEYYKNIIEYDIIFDGGNIELFDNGGLLCDKIFKENPTISKNKLITQLETIFERELAFLPKEPYDPIGHIDGMCRIVNDVCIVNNYHLTDFSYAKKIDKCLNKISNLFAINDVIYLPYKHGSNMWSVIGSYINFLIMKDIIIIPVYNIELDNIVVDIMSNKFKNKQIYTIPFNDISIHGGSIHCISNQILKLDVI